MAQIKTIDTVAGENQIDFKRRYPFVWLKNLGDADVYISDKAGIVAEADGVVLLGAGQAAMLENYDDCVYVLGATTIEAHGQHSADSPFGDTIVAGGGGGPAPVLIEKNITQNGVYDPEDDNADGYSMIDVEVPVVDVIELNANMNRTYTAPAGKAYSPVNVSVPGTSISKLTVAHNNVTYEAGIGTAFDPVEVSIPMDTLNAPSNGVYEIDENTDGWDTVLVDTYEKYNELFFSNATSISSQGFAKNIISEGYNDIWCVGYYAYSDGYGNQNTSLWCSRYPIDTIFPLVPGRLFGCNGSDNYLWVTFNSTGNYAATHLSSYDTPYMYVGFKNKDMVQDILWQSTESSTPNTITLSESIFDYDEVCFFMIKGDGATSATWYLTSELEIGDIIRGYDDTDQSTYTIASNTTLTIATEQLYRLYTVYGIKDSSMEKTTLYTNPDDTMPQTIDLSESYTNFDELVIEGHVSGGIVCEQRYPVITFGRRADVPADDRIQISTKDVSSWFTILSETSMSVDDNRIMVDKIIGIKRPVISTAHELIDVIPLTANSNITYTAPAGKAYSPVTVQVPPQVEIITRVNWDLLSEQQKQAKGLVAIQDSSTGFLRGDFVNGADYIPVGRYIPNSNAANVICEAYVDNFDATSTKWGNGSNPIQYMYPSLKPIVSTAENAISAQAYTNNVVPYVDLGTTGVQFTAYAVLKPQNMSLYKRIFSAMAERTYNMGILLYGSPVYVSSWGSDTATGISANDYIVVAMKYGTECAAYLYDSANDDTDKISKSPTTVGRFITIGRTDISVATENADPCDMLIRYLAVVNEAEADITIENNLRALYSQFVASE